MPLTQKLLAIQVDYKNKKEIYSFFHNLFWIVDNAFAGQQS